MFSLRILGNNGPYPESGGACSSYLVRAGDSNILMDAGSGSMSNLMKIMRPEQLDCIILSHLHWDHMTDIPVINYYLMLEGKKGEFPGKLDLYMPGSPGNMVAEIKKFNTFNIHILGNETVFEVGGCRLSFRRMTHPVESYATRLEYGSRSLVYTGDTTPNPQLPEFAGDCDMLLADSAFLHSQLGVGSPHMSSLQCARTALEAGVSKLVLTHKNPFVEASVYEKEAKSVFPDSHMAVLMEEMEV